jgi:hypothetical protein
VQVLVAITRNQVVSGFLRNDRLCEGTLMEVLVTQISTNVTSGVGTCP